MDCKHKKSLVMLITVVLIVTVTFFSAVSIYAQEKVSIRLGRPTHFTMVPDALVLEIFKEYQIQHPYVTIKYEPTPFREYFQKIGLSLSAGNAPDIFLQNEIWRYVQNEYLAPAPEKYDSDIKNNFGVAVVPTTWKGKAYGYPLEGGLRLTLYNIDMFEEAGIHIKPGEHLPAKDWQEYRDFALKTTKRSGGRIIQEGFKVPSETTGNVVCSLASFFWGAGGEFYSPEQDRICLDQPATYKALQFWGDMVKKDKISDARYELDTFAKNRCAMFIAGQYYLGHLKQDAPFINYGVFFTPPPKVEAGEGIKAGELAYDNQPWMYVVSADSSPSAKEESWKFLQWLTGDENAVQLAKAGASLYRVSAIEVAKPKVNVVLRTYLEAQKYVHPRTPKYWRFLVTRFPPEIQNFLLGKKSIFDAVLTAQQQINEDIKTGRGRL